MMHKGIDRDHHDSLRQPHYGTVDAVAVPHGVIAGATTLKTIQFLEVTVPR